MPQYEIKCSCGRIYVVDLRQAGSSVECTCGRTLEVPSRSELLTRDAAAESAAPAVGRQEATPASARVWLALAAAGVLLIAGISALVIWLTWPQMLPLEEMPPAIVVGYWQHIRTGIDAPLVGYEQQFGHARRLYRGYAMADGLLALVGVVLLVLAFVAPSNKPPPETDTPSDEDAIDDASDDADERAPADTPSAAESPGTPG